jgi:phosphoribosylglycinamide formyltransferase-1
MLRIVFLCSGGGGNLRFIAQTIRDGLLSDADIVGVITDRECPAGSFARQNNLPVWEHDFSEAGQPYVEKRLVALDPEIIISNVHRILSPTIVKSFQGRLINLHYSLLPSFGGVIGAKALSQALNYGAQLVGTTVHMVDDHVDAGTPLVQAAVPVRANDDLPTLMDVVFRVGCMTLFAGIQSIRQDKKPTSEEPDCLTKVSGRPILINPPIAHMPQWQEESFWDRLK